MINDINYKLILEQPFFHDSLITFVYNKKGYQCAKFTNEDKTKVGITRVYQLESKLWRKARVENEVLENK